MSIIILICVLSPWLVLPIAFIGICEEISLKTQVFFISLFSDITELLLEN